jgi:cellobiose phosphorylase
LLKDNFEKMKRDADELADLAKSLQEDLNKSNENVFSLGVVDKADKIEKLAKKIKGTARGY